MRVELEQRCGKTPEISELAATRRNLVDMGRILAALYDEALDGGSEAGAGWGADIHLMRLSYSEQVLKLEKTVASKSYHDRVVEYLQSNTRTRRRMQGRDTKVWWRYRGGPQGEHADAYAIAIAGYSDNPCRWTKMHMPIGAESLLIHGPTWLHHSMANSGWGESGTSAAYLLSPEAGDYLRSINNHGRDWGETVRAAKALDARRLERRASRDAVS